MLSFKKLTIVFMSAILIGGTVGATVGATTSSAASYTEATHNEGIMFAGGPGHPGKVWAGTWNNGKSGFCIDFGSATPNHSGTTLFDKNMNIPKMTAEATKQAKFVANKYAGTASKEDAANAGLAIWRYRSDSNFEKWYSWARSTNVITPARHNKVMSIVFDAREHGPYKMGVRLTEVGAGQVDSGTVRVQGSDGWPAVGRAVTLTPTQFAVPNGTILKVNGVAGNRGTTGSNGLVTFTYKRTSAGKVGVKATLTTWSSEKANLSLTSYRHQRTLSGGLSDTRVAYWSYVTDKLGIAQGCDSDCNGLSTVTFRATNPKGTTQAIKWVEKVDGRVVATLDVKAGAAPVRKTVRVMDGKMITTSYCYTGSVVGGPCKKALVVFGSPYEVICPAWAQGELKLLCNCTPDGAATVTLAGPAGSPRFYRGFVSIDKGMVIHQVDLVNGKPSTFPLGKLAANTRVVVSFKAYRDRARTIQMLSRTCRTSRSARPSLPYP